MYQNFITTLQETITKPTLGKGNSSSNMPYQGDMLVPWRVYCIPYQTKSIKKRTQPKSQAQTQKNLGLPSPPKHLQQKTATPPLPPVFFSQLFRLLTSEKKPPSISHRKGLTCLTHLLKVIAFQYWNGLGPAQGPGYFPYEIYGSLSKTGSLCHGLLSIIPI